MDDHRTRAALPAQIAADPLGIYVLAGLVPGPDGSSADATPPIICTTPTC
ncbi:hypothetical protein [Nannocystis pusilla]